MDETTCSPLCQHPSCWASQRRQENGIPRTLPPLNDDSDSSDVELNLPKQSICNLLEDYGDSQSDRYPVSTGGRPSHIWESSHRPEKRTSRSLDAGYKLGVSPIQSLRSLPVRNPHLRLVEVQELFDRHDLNSQWDETFITKPYYIWAPNPTKIRRKIMRSIPDTINPQQPLLMRDLTSCMVPPEIEHRRENTILFDEWPVLKKKSTCVRSPASGPVQQFQILTESAAKADITIDMEGFQQKRWRNVPKNSDFMTMGKLHRLVQDCVHQDARAQIALSTQEHFKQKRLTLHDDPPSSALHSPHHRPVYQMDDHEVLERMSSVNTLNKDRDVYSETDTMDSFPRYRKPLPGICAPRKTARGGHQPLTHQPKIPSISLGLPELPSGVKTTRTFSYKRQDFDFSLGPVISCTSSVQSSISGDFSEHGTTVKVNMSHSGVGQQGEDLAIHSVSSTHIPKAPVVTPSTSQTPGKEFNSSRLLGVAQSPSSRDAREETIPLSLRRHHSVAMETKLTHNDEEAASPSVKSGKSVESCPSPEQWPLVSEMSFEKAVTRPLVSEPGLDGRSRSDRRLTSRGKGDNAERSAERVYAKKVLDEKRKAESPAPPPPSPEPPAGDQPKHCTMKELKSREDSLAMTPLFEESEMEESTPTTKGFDDDVLTGRMNDSRRKKTRTIEVTVPAVKNDKDEEKKDDVDDDKEEEKKVDADYDKEEEKKGNADEKKVDITNDKDEDKKDDGDDENYEKKGDRNDDKKRGCVDVDKEEKKGDANDEDENEKGDTYEGKDDEDDRYQGKGDEDDRYQGKGDEDDRYEGKGDEDDRYQGKGDEDDRYEGKGEDNKFEKNGYAGDDKYEDKKGDDGGEDKNDDADEE